MAEISPLLSAVKNDDMNKLIPVRIKQIEKIRKACVVKFSRFSSYPTNMLERGFAKTNDINVITAPDETVRIKLFFKIFLSSLWFCEP